MPVSLATSLIASAGRLAGTDAKQLWAFVEKLEENPAHPSLSLERLTQVRDPHFWSARISRNLRAIIHQNGDSRPVLYAGQHDKAYDWARTRVLTRNSAIGALQIVESPAVLEDTLSAISPKARGIFDPYSDDYLMRLGTPPDWLPAVRKIVNVDLLYEVTDQLPKDVQDRLLDLADGKVVTTPIPVALDRPARESPDTQSEFVLLDDMAEFRKLLEAPLATWLVFLHPTQRRLATGAYRGPLKITGSAGTGKTVVALHRARQLAARGKRVFLTSYTKALCANLEASLRLLCDQTELSRITVTTVHARALTIVQTEDSQVRPINDSEVYEWLARARPADCPLSAESLESEWEDVIQAQGITTWEDYRTASRAGRGTALAPRDRRAVWTVIEAVRATLAHDRRITWTGLCQRARELLESGAVTNPFDTVIVDEVQDLGPQELRLLARLGGQSQDGLTLVGDGGQRIYGKGASLKSLGIDVRGRSTILRLNYRTTEEIRRFAERIIRHTADDLDGERDDRRRIRSLLTGPVPLLRGFSGSDQQYRFVLSE
ncbi:MAG TPA: UvrD-helicase domain-containing protein, partial [Chloroflexota bacterium]|nr:UvrD-helicase domain-containing protein [Chloroflexota bacterium]